VSADHNQARKHLLSLAPGNTNSMQAIESAILLVCLDEGHSSTEDERAWSYWSGGLDGSTRRHGRNRWFDKHQLIVDEAGESGFNGEREPQPSGLFADCELS
jgi:carnitine O-acetyltransferase